jgi:HK97 family phage prohead protease
MEKQLRRFDIRAADVTNTPGGVQNYRVTGYATTFDDKYVLWSYDGVDYCEIVDRRAFDDADMSDVIMQYDHFGHVIARTSNSTLKLTVDDGGLKIEADLSKTEESRKIYDEIKLGMITQMSLGFTVAETAYEEAKGEKITRILKYRKIYDVSAVAIPANPNTEIEARSKQWGNKTKTRASKARIAGLKIKLLQMGN